MVLVDAPVWVEHFRCGTIGLANLLNEGDVACHRFITGELACGNLSNRAEILYRTLTPRFSRPVIKPVLFSFLSC